MVMMIPVLAHIVGLAVAATLYTPRIGLRAGLRAPPPRSLLTVGSEGGWGRLNGVQTTHRCCGPRRVFEPQCGAVYSNPMLFTWELGRAE